MNPEGIGDERLRLRFNRPGVHPFLALQVPGGDGWETAALLGARQVRYYHKGASFPRVILSGNEVESGAGVAFERLPGPGGMRLTESRGGLSIETVLELEEELPLVHVVHRLTAGEDVEVNRVFDRYDFVAAPGAPGHPSLDYCHVPHLRPRSDMVMGDHIFRSPALMMRKGDLFFALVPDLELLGRAYGGDGARYYLDFQVSAGENQSPAACFGLGRSRVRGHLYFENDFQRETGLPAGSSFELGYYLALARGRLAESDVTSFMWDRYARPLLKSGGPQAADWDRYASAGLNRIFKRPDLFRQFSLEGQKCGGTVAMHFATRRGVRLMSLGELRRYLRYQDVILAAVRRIIKESSERRIGRLVSRALYRYGPKVPPQVMLQSWFNNLRSAYGAYWFGRKWRDQELIDRALAVKNLAILAPGEGGAFPAVCYATDEGLYWSKGTRGFKHVDSYHTADCATTGYYMALWYDDHEGDPRLLARCRDLAGLLLDAQLDSGAFPAWVKPGRAAAADSTLRESATTACPAMFLARLFTLESDERYLRAAVRACDFLATEVVPSQKWFDYETFFSCSHKKPGFFDTYTGCYPQNTMSMYWAAEALRLAYLCTLERGFLELGLKVLGHLSLYQQVWDPPFLSINAFGGFGSMNTDGEWNDARQALMAPLFMDYYTLTGEPEHMERGIAALRAAFALMYIEENKASAPGNMMDAPGDEYGSVPENYGHFGYDQPVPGFLDSDWGAGSACQAAAYVQKHYGDIYVDLERGAAFGINGCRVAAMNVGAGALELEVLRHVESASDITVRLAGAGRRLDVIVNGRPTRATANGDYLVLL